MINDKHAGITEQQMFQMLQDNVAPHAIDHDDRNGRQEYHHNGDDIVRFQLDFSQKPHLWGVNIGLHDTQD
jgi:hypothetical protein